MLMDASSPLDRCPLCNAVLFTTQQAVTSGKCPFCVPNADLETYLPADDCLDVLRTEPK
jgi:hypothetical protein